MKLLLLPLILLGIYFANSSEFPSKLPQKTCEIIREIHKEDFSIKTIAIVKMERKFDEKVIDELTKCLSRDFTVTLIDVFGYNLNHDVRHSPTLNVLLVDVLTTESLTILLNIITGKYPILNFDAKFVVMTQRQDEFYRRSGLIENLNLYYMINHAVIYEDNGKVYADYNRNKGKPILLDSIDFETIQKIFPDHLKNRDGHIHKILVTEEMPGIRMVNGTLRSKYFHFLESIEKFENSRMLYMNIQGPLTREQFRATVLNAYQRRMIEVSLIRTMHKEGAINPLQTYEEVGLCSMVPRPQGLSRVFSFVKPFDWAVWTGILVTIMVCMILWRFSGSSVSCWFIPFFFWSFALGQGVDFGTNKKALVILLQIWVFMLLILGNAYQGVITSVMIEPEQAEQLKSFDELLQSQYKIFVAEARHNYLMDYPAYKNVSKTGNRIIVAAKEFSQMNLTALYEENVAFLVNCDLGKFYIENGYDSMFYMINEKLFPSYVVFSSINLNIYLRRWQMLMDWSYEGGLMQAWEKMDKDEKIITNVEDNLSDILKFGDIFLVFHALIFGYILGIIALICEVIVNACLKRRIRIHAM